MNPEEAGEAPYWRRAEALLWLPALFGLGWLLWDLSYWWQKFEDYNFGWLVPALSGYLIYDNWSEIRKPGRPDGRFYLWAWLLAVPVFALVEANRRLVSPAASFSWLLALATIGGVAATILAARGPRCLRLCLFPLLFLLVAVPLPGTLLHGISQGLQRFVAAVNVEVLGLMGIAALQKGNVVQLRDCAVGIDEACSGIRSLQSSIMVALLMGKILLDSLGARVLLVLMAPLIAIPGNICRTLILSLSAHYGGLAQLKKMHDAAGWSILVVNLVGLGIAVILLRKLEGLLASAPPGKTRRVPHARPAADQ